MPCTRLGLEDSKRKMVNPVNRNYIKRLTIAGFQVFAEPVDIPLGPLTLLYGPNSAGKSAILDAMLALADLCDIRVPAKRSTASDVHRINSMMARHWRRQSTVPSTPAETMRLGATIRISGGAWALAGFAAETCVGFGPQEPKTRGFEEAYSVLQPLAKAVHIELTVSIEYGLADAGGLQLAHQVFAQEKRIAIDLDGSPLLRFFESESMAAINLDHPALRGWSAAAVLKQMARDCEFTVEDGWVGMGISRVIDGWLSTNAVDDVEGRIPEEALPQVRDSENSFIEMFNALFQASLRSISHTLRVPLVQASRSVPRRSEVTFLLAEDGTPLSGESVGLQINGLSENLEIVRSAFATELERTGVRKSPEWAGKLLPRSPKDPVDLVNRLLSDYLFRDSGYFVAAGVHELTALGLGSGDDVGYTTKKGGRKFLVSLELRDSVGRHFYFDEVGSGLGYVLPVLLAVASSEAAFLQQPELHLHPALQSELADALVAVLGDSDFGGRKSKGCQQIIVETHSEHLLLRLLRRVRQAAEPDRSLDPHSLGREDVVVLYVDPKPDGESTVKHLRIARDGEFIDRWPRGFFEERWTELFDE